MKTILAIFLFAILSSHSALALEKPRDCKPPTCNKEDPKLATADGGATLISCAPVNGFEGKVELSFDPNCSKCLRTACDKARIDNEPVISPEGNESDINAHTAKKAH